MDNLVYIETYFNGELSLERKKEFEERIIADPEFAKEVAFYLSLKETLVAEIMKEKERFKGMYERYKQGSYSGKQTPALLRKLLPWVAAAAILALVFFGWSLWFKSVPPQQLADQYLSGKLQILPVKMGGKEDSLQAGLRLYNEARLEEALQQFENILLADSAATDAKKYAGIVSLRLEQYDKAIRYFSQLEKARLYANPGKFYHALTLMKRNGTGDKQEAKVLLEQVLQADLAEKEVAREWLKKWQ